MSRPVMTNESVKIVCIMILILASWGAFLYCLHTGAEKDVLEGVGFVSGLLTFFGVLGMLDL